jgi:hypothetical protein
VVSYRGAVPQPIESKLAHLPACLWPGPSQRREWVKTVVDHARQNKKKVVYTTPKEENKVGEHIRVRRNKMI